MALSGRTSAAAAREMASLAEGSQPDLASKPGSWLLGAPTGTAPPCTFSTSPYGGSVMPRQHADNPPRTDGLARRVALVWSQIEQTPARWRFILLTSGCYSYVMCRLPFDPV